MSIGCPLTPQNRHDGLLELTRLLEEKLHADFAYELLELHYIPYAFGSGTKAYRINGRHIKIAFDGRDGRIEIQISNQHEKYSSSNWTSIFQGSSSDFVEKGIQELTDKISQ